jgi:hypothetical protein
MMSTTSHRHVGIGTLIFGPILLVALILTAIDYPLVVIPMIVFVVAWALLSSRR